MKEFLLILPEILLAFTLALVVLSEITHYGEKIRLVTFCSFLGLISALIQTLISYEWIKTEVFFGVISIDGFSLFFKLIFITLAILHLFSISHTQEVQDNRRSEYCVLILSAVLSMCLVASAVDFILAFLSLLFLNLISYFLSAYGLRSLPSTEASIKYFIFGSVSTVLFLYGAALLFTLTHSLNLYEMHKALQLSDSSTASIMVPFVFILLAFCFQCGAFPYHLFIPDILEGSPTPVAGFISVGTRAASFAMATRFLITLFAQPIVDSSSWQIVGSVDWTKIVEIISMITLLVGALMAYRQTGAKRLVGYLVVAETGYLLIGILVLDPIGITGLLYNLVIELFALSGIFYIFCFFFDQLQSDRLVDLKGMLKKATPECIYLIVFLLCLVGSPPTPGFIGKFTLLSAAIAHHRLGLAMIGGASMVLSTAAVIRLAYTLVGDFKSSDAFPIKPSFSRKIFLGALMFPMIIVGLFADFVLSWARESLDFTRW